MKVVCLTATPDDGVDDGLERDLMKLMGYKLIKTSKADEVQAPKIDQFCRIN